MKGKTHLIIGFAAGVTFALSKDIENLSMLLIGSSIGSLIPDIDHPKSKINQKLLQQKNKSYKILFYTLIGIGFLYSYTLNNKNFFLLAGFITILIGVSKHRGFTHSLLGVFLFTKLAEVLVLYGYSDLYLGISIGYISHLFGDFFTKGGIKLFYPFEENFSFPITIKTGSKSEGIIAIILLIYSFYGITKYFNIFI